MTRVTFCWSCSGGMTSISLTILLMVSMSMSLARTMIELVAWSATTRMFCLAAGCWAASRAASPPPGRRKRAATAERVGRLAGTRLAGALLGTVERIVEHLGPAAALACLSRMMWKSPGPGSPCVNRRTRSFINSSALGSSLVMISLLPNGVIVTGAPACPGAAWPFSGIGSSNRREDGAVGEHLEAGALLGPRAGRLARASLRRRSHFGAPPGVRCAPGSPAASREEFLQCFGQRRSAAFAEADDAEVAAPPVGSALITVMIASISLTCSGELMTRIWLLAESPWITGPPTFVSDTSR